MKTAACDRQLRAAAFLTACLALCRSDHPTRNQMLMCSELIYTDMDAYRSLWTFLATKHDLVGNITIAKVPGDDPAPTVFLEPRLLRTKVEAEGTWWRIVDVKGALEARSYSTALGDTLTLAVEDDERLAPWNIGADFLLPFIASS